MRECITDAIGAVILVGIWLLLLFSLSMIFQGCSYYEVSTCGDVTINGQRTVNPRLDAKDNTVPMMP